VIGPRQGIRWRSVILVVSLALNLFFAGLFVARHAFGPPRGPDAMLSRLSGEFAADLAEPDRATVRRIVKAREAEIKQLSLDAMQARAGIRAAMVSEPFDAGALGAAVDKAGASDVAMRGAIERMLVEAATQVSPDGRRTLAEWRPLRH
jgi:uncharacterized membrane protein